MMRKKGVQRAIALGLVAVAVIQMLSAAYAKPKQK